MCLRLPLCVCVSDQSRVQGMMSLQSRIESGIESERQEAEAGYRSRAKGRERDKGHNLSGSSIFLLAHSYTDRKIRKEDDGGGESVRDEMGKRELCLGRKEDEMSEAAKMRHRISLFSHQFTSD